jgi:UDP-N-acetylglucosamine 4,6-dehydratase/5-epimerase
MMEKLMVARSRVAVELGTVMCGTRYGNVMGSRGSVIPLFMQQIREGKPITMTDPKMTRFMMSIEDAVDLVIYAYEHGVPGDVFVQKAPAATIGVLAQAVKKLFGVPQHPVKVIGTRHGEKLYEALLTREEMSKAEDMGGYYRIPADNRDLNYAVYFTRGAAHVSQNEDYNSHNTARLDVDKLAALLEGLDFVSSELRAWRESKGKA